MLARLNITVRNDTPQSNIVSRLWMEGCPIKAGRLLDPTMPALSDLQARVQADPGWLRTYLEAIGEADKIAQRIPLLHVTEGRVADILLSADPALQVSKGDMRDKTESAEEILSLGRCVYLYAGRARPRSGGAALAFGAGSEDLHTGGAVPFDTGGLVAGLIHTNLRDMSPRGLRAFVAESDVPLARWRNQFQHYLAAYFDPPVGYWDSRPSRPDPEGIFENPRNTWQSWTWEIRFQQKQPLDATTFWCASPTQMNAYERTQLRAVGGARAVLREFKQRALKKEGDLDYCRLVEMTARETAVKP